MSQSGQSLREQSIRVHELAEVVRGDLPMHGDVHLSNEDPMMGYWREIVRAENLKWKERTCQNNSAFLTQKGIVLGVAEADIGEEEISEKGEFTEFETCQESQPTAIQSGEQYNIRVTPEPPRWTPGFHSDLFGKLAREILPPLRTSYVHTKKTGWHTESGRIVQDPGIPDLDTLSPKGMIHHNRIDDLRQLSYALPKDRRGKILGSQIFHLKEVGKVFSRLPDEEFFNKIQTRIDLIANYFDRQDPKYWQRKDIPAFPCAENLDQLYFFEYKSEKERLAANVKEFPGGSGEVLQEKYDHPTNSLSNPSQGLVIGCEVLHPAFGKGVLKGHDKSEVARDSYGRITDFSKMKLEIEFPSGTKRILAKFCKLILDDGRVVTF